MTASPPRDVRLDRLQLLAVVLPLAYIPVLIITVAVLGLSFWLEAIAATAISLPFVAMFAYLVFSVVGDMRDELLQREEKFRGLLESAPDGIVIVDTDGRIVIVNAQTERLFGYTAAELMGQRVEMLLPERVRDVHVGHRGSYHNAPGTRPMGVGLDLVGRRRDGSEFPAEISLSPIETEDGMLVTSVIRDITDRKKADDALRSSYALLNAVVEGTSDAVYVKDLESRYVLINSAGAAVFGLLPEQVVGRSDAELFGEGTAEEIMAHDRAVMASGEMLTLEEAGSAQGEEHLFLSTKHVLRDGDGRISGMVGVSKDITERRRLEDERERLLAERETERERQRIGMDLHDGIIQSIYAVGLGLEEALDDMTREPQAARGRIDAAVDQLNDVIRDIRSYIFDLRPTRFSGDLESSLGNLVAEFRVNSLIDVDVHIAPDLPRFNADRSMAIFHIAKEALNNVRKHARASAASLRLHTVNGAVQLEITDNGAGFDPEEGRSDEHRGLMNMSSRARAAGGTLCVESAPDAGTSIRVDIPV